MRVSIPREPSEDVVKKIGQRYDRLRKIRIYGPEKKVGEKKTPPDFILHSDMDIIFQYYNQVHYQVLADIEGRGLTVYCAPENPDSFKFRRNVKPDERLVANEPEDIGRIIRDYNAFRFIPDVNVLNSLKISRIPIDLDRQPFDVNTQQGVDWKVYYQFVNGFKDWLASRGFEVKTRLSGGNGAHLIIEMDVDRVVPNYVPFPTDLKFDTWMRNRGIYGLIARQARDAIRVLGLAYTDYLKKIGKSVLTTIEMREKEKRRSKILIDSSRAVIDQGIVSLGSINHKTGRICMPVKELPSELSLKKVVEVSRYPDTETLESNSRFQWMQTIANNPSLLYEPPVRRGDNPISLLNDLFHDWGWLVERYLRQQFTETTG